MGVHQIADDAAGGAERIEQRHRRPVGEPGRYEPVRRVIDVAARGAAPGAVTRRRVHEMHHSFANHPAKKRLTPELRLATPGR